MIILLFSWNNNNYRLPEMLLTKEKKIIKTSLGSMKEKNVCACLILDCESVIKGKHAKIFYLRFNCDYDLASKCNSILLWLLFYFLLILSKFLFMLHFKIKKCL